MQHLIFQYKCILKKQTDNHNVDSARRVLLAALHLHTRSPVGTEKQYRLDIQAHVTQMDSNGSFNPCCSKEYPGVLCYAFFDDCNLLCISWHPGKRQHCTTGVSYSLFF